MNSNNKNVWFIVVFLLVLAMSFGAFQIWSSVDSSSMYTQLIHGGE